MKRKVNIIIPYTLEFGNEAHFKRMVKDLKKHPHREMVGAGYTRKGSSVHSYSFE